MIESDLLETKLGLRPAPRTTNLTTAICALFGGFITQFGWGFFGFGLVFFWIFSFDAIQTDVQFSRPLMRTQANLEAVTYSNARVNKQPVMGHHYSFSHQGKQYTGISYVTSESLSVPQAVPIEFVIDEPRFSRITLPGFRASTFNGWVGLLVLIFPLAGLALLIPGTWLGLKTLRLMRDGRLVMAKLMEQKPTGSSVKINGKIYPVYKLRFAYSVGGRMYDTSLKTHEVERLVDEAQEKLLYLPSQPSFALPVDAVPGKVYIDGQGYFCTDQNVLFYLILPAATVTINGLLLLSKL